MEKKINANKTIVYSEDELSMGKVLSLVFIPAVLILAVFILSSILLKDYVPAYLCLIAAIALVLVPFEIAVIVTANKKKYGKFGFKAAFKRHVPMPLWKIVLLALVLFLWSRLVFSRMIPFEYSLVMKPITKFVPEYLITDNFFVHLMQYPKWIISLTWITLLIFNGILGPIVEELYFRGYLMSRMERFGIVAPFIVTVLFSLYHLFTPWQNSIRIISLIPLHYCIWKYKNLYIGMLSHCALNLAGVISLYGVFFR